jgi:hypothetical protein
VGGSASVLGSLDSMLQRGQIGKIARGFGDLAAAAGTAWAAFKAGQAIRESIEEWLKSGAQKAREFIDTLNTAGNPAASLKSINTEIDRLNSALAYASEHPIRAFFDATDTGVIKEQLAGLNKEAGSLFKTLQAIDAAKAARKAREEDAARVKAQAQARDAATQRFFESQRREAERLKDLDADIARDKLGILRQRITNEADEQSRLRLQRQAEEMESAQRIAEFQRQLDAETDGEAKALIRQRIELEKKRATLAIAGIKPDAGEKAELGKAPEALSKGSIDEARALFMAASQRKPDAAEQRQTRLQEQMAKSLRDISARLKEGADVEIMLL